MWAPALGYPKALSFNTRCHRATLSTLAAKTKTVDILTETHDVFGYMDLQVLESRWLQHMQLTTSKRGTSVAVSISSNETQIMSNLCQNCSEVLRIK